MASVSTGNGAEVYARCDSLSVSVLVSYLVVVLDARPNDRVDGKLAFLNECRRSHGEATSPAGKSVSL